MKERIYHLSSFSCLVGIPWNSYNVANALMIQLLDFRQLSSPTIKKNRYTFANEWFFLTPLVETSGRDQQSSLVDFLPPQQCDTHSPSQPAVSHIHSLSQQDHQTEPETYQMKLDFILRIHLKYFEVQFCNKCWLYRSDLPKFFSDDSPSHIWSWDFVIPMFYLTRKQVHFIQQGNNLLCIT